MKVNRFTYSYTGVITASWIKAAQQICNQMALDEVPDDIDQQAVVIDNEARRVAKMLKIDTKHWPESLSIQAE